jgi:polyisoprenoid-binding protein YceI
MRTPTKLAPALLTVALGALAGAAVAAPASYNIDSAHTYPAFEADHMGGVSLWRGKINSSKGTITLDKAANAGTVDITMDMTTIDFGHDALNKHANTPDIFDTAKFPEAKYTGKLVKFQNGAPTEVEGTLTMHGVTKPLTLKVNSFRCIQDPRAMKERCGADATATLMRDEYGVDFGKTFGFKMDVTLRISVEALAAT